MPTVVDNANVVNRRKDTQNERSPSHEEIADLAYRLWRERGQGDGHADEDWIRAEKQLADRAL